MLNADEIASLRLRDQFIENYCTVTRSGSPVYTYVDYVPKEGGVTFLIEGASKTQLDLKAEVRTLTPKKAAGYTRLTQEAVQDIPRMESEARINIFKKYILKRQNGILFGDGLNGNPTGITVIAPAWNAATWTGTKKAAANVNLYDAIIAAKNQIEMAANWTDDVDYSPNVCFLNPADYNALLIRQDDKNYIFNQAAGTIDVSGIKIVSKKEIPAGKMLIGDFTKLEIINYIDYSVKVGWVNDDFIKNQFVMLGEGRFFVLVREYDKLAFMYDDISDVLAGITAA